MKKKGPKSIPDFSSSKRKDKPAAAGQESAAKPPAPVTTRNIKPQATSAKSGRRGG